MDANILLCHLTSSKREQVASALTRHCLSPGEHIDLSAPYYYLIESGTVEVRTKKRDDENATKEECELGPTQSFGEPQHWCPIESALARTCCVLWALDHALFEAVLGSYKEQYMAITTGNNIPIL